MAFLKFPHILWEATKPTIALTDNKSVKRFSQMKAIPPALWIACVYLLQFNFKNAHIAVSVNTLADFFPKLQLKVTEKIGLKIREGIQTTPIEVTTSSWDVADEEQFFFTQAGTNDELDKQTFERKIAVQTKSEANEGPSSLRTIVIEITKIDGNTTSYSLSRIRTNARIRVDQEVDLVLKNMKLKTPGKPHDEILMMTDSRYKPYKANEDRILHKDGLLFKNYFGETFNFHYY